MVSRPRERERARGRRGSPDHTFDIAGEPRAPVRRSHAPDRTGLVNRSTVLIAPCRSISPSISPPRDLAFNPSIFDSLISLSLSLSLWFWFLLLLWWCGSGVLVVVAFDCQSLLSWVELKFRWCVVLGFGCDLFDILCNKICLDVEKIAEKMWKFCRKITFSE